MIRRKRNIRIYVRNKIRYNPAAKVYDFLHVDVTNFAGTTIGDIKEEVKKKCKNSLKIDDLYLNNQPLADDRSVAHYNLEDGTILETTSNPFWVTCLYTKQIEVEREQAQNPDDKHTQNWTQRSLARKKTLLSVLLNSKKEFRSQPPHFPELEDFVMYLERLDKKGAVMNPNYTQKDLQLMYEDYITHDLNSDDPVGAFIHRNAVRLGLRQPGRNQFDNRGTDLYGDVEINNNNKTKNNNNKRSNTGPVAGTSQEGRNTPRTPRARNKERWCEDCETNKAELFCPECQNARGGQGLSLCRYCSQSLHAGAARRRHDVKDITQAPKVSQSYVPHAYKAPFALLVGMYSGLTDRPPKLSMTEIEIKIRAQPLTDTDLQDKQNGRYVGGFECMENSLMLKSLVQREDSASPTYALTDTGQELSEILFSFQQTVQRFMRSHDLPQIPTHFSTVCGTRKICLIIDEQERDRDRLLDIAVKNNIDAQVRRLPAGDYIWILTPPLPGQHVKYTQCQPVVETVLPFIVERKSWEDLEDSLRTKRFHKQVNNMLESGLTCFYLLEGYVQNLRYRPTEQHQKYLKGQVEKLLLDHGFYLSYTGSWFKSASWLVWFTHLVTEAYRTGNLKERSISYTTYINRTNGQHVDNTLQQSDFRLGQLSTWTSQKFIDAIFSDWYKEKTLLDSVKEEVGNNSNRKCVLVIQNLESYNKKRQSLMNKCLFAVNDNPNNVEDTIKKSLNNKHEILHYDVMCYLQLKIQVLAQVYVVRTETDAETQRLQIEVQERSGTGQSSKPHGHIQQKTNHKTRKHKSNEDLDENRNISEDTGQQQNGRILQTDFASDSQTENFMIQQALALSSTDNIQETRSKGKKGRNATPRKTKSSYTSTQTIANVTAIENQEEQLQIAMRQSLEDTERHEAEKCTRSGRKRISPASQKTFKHDSDDEILQKVLKQSLEEAKLQNVIQNENIESNEILNYSESQNDPMTVDTQQSQINPRLTRKRRNQDSRASTPDEELKLVFERGKFESGSHSSDSHDEQLKRVIEQSKIETSNTSTVISGSLTDSQELDLVLEQSNIETGATSNISGGKVIDNMDDELKIAIERSKTDTGIVSVVDRNLQDDNFRKILKPGKADTDLNVGHDGGIGLVLQQSKIETNNDISKSHNSGLTDSQDEELQLILRQSKQEYETTLEKSWRSDLSQGKADDHVNSIVIADEDVIEIIDSQELENDSGITKLQEEKNNIGDVVKDSTISLKSDRNSDIVLIDSQETSDKENNENLDCGHVSAEVVPCENHVTCNFNQTGDTIDSQEAIRSGVNSLIANLQSQTDISTKTTSCETETVDRFQSVSILNVENPEQIDITQQSQSVSLLNLPNHYQENSEQIDNSLDISQQSQSVSLLDPLNYVNENKCSGTKQDIDISVSDENKEDQRSISTSDDPESHDSDLDKPKRNHSSSSEEHQAASLLSCIEETSNRNLILKSLSSLNEEIVIKKQQVLVEDSQDVSSDITIDRKLANSVEGNDGKYASGKIISETQCNEEKCEDNIVRHRKLRAQESFSKIYSDSEDIDVIPPSPEKKSFTPRLNRSYCLPISADNSGTRSHLMTNISNSDTDKAEYLIKVNIDSDEKSSDLFDIEKNSCDNMYSQGNVSESSVSQQEERFDSVKKAKCRNELTMCNSCDIENTENTSPVQSRHKKLTLDNNSPQEDFDTAHRVLPPLYDNSQDTNTPPGVGIICSTNREFGCENTDESFNDDIEFHNDSCDLPSPDKEHPNGTLVTLGTISPVNKHLSISSSSELSVIPEPVSAFSSNSTGACSQVIGTSTGGTDFVGTRTDNVLCSKLDSCDIKSEPNEDQNTIIDDCSSMEINDQQNGVSLSNSVDLIKVKLEPDICNNTISLHQNDKLQHVTIKQEKLDLEKYSNYQNDKETVSVSQVDSSGIEIKDEPGSPGLEFSSDISSDKVVDDAELARKLQEEFDREYEMSKVEESSNSKRTTRQSAKDSLGELSENNDSEVKTRDEVFQKQNKCCAKIWGSVQLNYHDTKHDEEIARQLQQALMKGDNSAQELHNSEYAKHSHDYLLSVDTPANKNTEMIDLDLAKQLQDDILSREINEKKNIEFLDSEYAKRLQEELESVETMKDKNIEQIDSEYAKRLQENLVKEELEINDLEYAKRLQEIDDDVIITEAGSIKDKKAERFAEICNRTDIRSRVLADTTRSPQKRKGDNFPFTPSSSAKSRKMSQVIEDSIPSSLEALWNRKLTSVRSREKIKSTTQLEEIRRQKHEQYQSRKSQTYTPSRPASATITRPKSSVQIPITDTQPETSQFRRHTNANRSFNGDDGGDVVTLDDDGFITLSPPSSPLEVVPFISNTPKSSWCKDETSHSSASTVPNASQKSQSSDRTSFISDMSDEKFSSTPSSSVQSEALSNVTCSVCGEKGHTRVWQKCPKYFSREEMTHRQNKEEKRRKETEEKERREQRTRDELKHHELALDAIIEQIQQEKNGLGQTIKQLDKKKKQRDKRH